MSFYKWAHENGYTDELTIERIDNNKGYSPDNCTWIPPTQQMKNRDFKGVHGEAHGGSKLTEEDIKAIRATPIVRGTKAQLARKYGVSQPTIQRVLEHKNWRNV